MELRHLRYFVVVAEELHFSRAAARLNIAAPTLSAQIQALEAMLGAPLFTRKTRKVALTHVGRRFLEEARATLRLAEKAELVGRRAAKGEIGSLAIGYILAAACSGFISASIAQFRLSYPDVSPQFRRMQTIPQLAALIDGSLDIGFVRAPPRLPAGLTGFIVDRQPLCVAMPDDHRFVAHSLITPEMLAGETLVATLLDTEVGHWSNIGAIMPPGLSVNVATKVADTTSLLLSVAAGFGLGIVPESIARSSVGGVAFRRVAGVSRTSDHMAAYRQNESAPLINAFVAMMRTKMRKSRQQAA
jgi:DNA-binding transcriptional LysR family regulator